MTEKSAPPHAISGWKHLVIPPRRTSAMSVESSRKRFKAKLEEDMMEPTKP